MVRISSSRNWGQVRATVPIRMPMRCENRLNQSNINSHIESLQPHIQYRCHQGTREKAAQPSSQPGFHTLRP